MFWKLLYGRFVYEKWYLLTALEINVQNVQKFRGGV
jgi:hypothetical protein